MDGWNALFSPEAEGLELPCPTNVNRGDIGIQLVATLSIAISLKRIAASLEAIESHMDGVGTRRDPFVVEKA